MEKDTYDKVRMFVNMHISSNPKIALELSTCSPTPWPRVSERFRSQRSIVGSRNSAKVSRISWPALLRIANIFALGEALPPSAATSKLRLRAYFDSGSHHREELVQIEPPRSSSELHASASQVQEIAWKLQKTAVSLASGLHLQPKARPSIQPGRLFTQI